MVENFITCELLILFMYVQFLLCRKTNEPS